MHHYLRAIFRESNRERYYETPVAAKAKTVRAKEPRKPSRKLVRIIEPNRYPVFRRRSYKFVNSHDFKRTVSVEFNEQCPLFDLSPDSMATTRHYQRVMPCARYPTAALGRHRPWKTCRTQSAENRCHVTGGCRKSIKIRMWLEP